MKSRVIASACVALTWLAMSSAIVAQTQTKTTMPRQTKPPAKAPAVEKPVPFAPGETLSYDISWSAFVTAATATVTVREKRPSFNSTAYYIVAEGQPTALVSALYKLYYKADTLLDAFTLLPQRASLFSKEGSRQRLRETRFEQDAKKGSYEIQAGEPLKRTLQVPLTLSAPTQDPLSAIFTLRTLDLRAGQTFSMPVSMNGETYKVQLTVGERENVASGIGQVRCWKITPVMTAADNSSAGTQEMAIWISDDARRLPVSMQAVLPVGRFALTLREASGLSAR